MRNPNLPGSWQQGLQDGFNNWNSRSTNVSFAMNGTSNNEIWITSYHDGRYGTIYDITVVGTQLRRFDISFNPIMIDLNRPQVTNLRNVVASTTAHELGHAVGLCDNPTVQGGVVMHSIMWTGRNRNNVTLPWPFDVQSVNWLY